MKEDVFDNVLLEGGLIKSLLSNKSFFNAHFQSLRDAVNFGQTNYRTIFFSNIQFCWKVVGRTVVRAKVPCFT